MTQNATLRGASEPAGRDSESSSHRQQARVIADPLDRLAAEACFDILDAGLERRCLLLQLGQVAGEDLAAPALVSHTRLDPAQPLHDGVVLLLDPLEPPR